jgi:uncharacterized protein YndB with AHSA1/START domain
MILTFAIVLVLGATALLIWDLSDQRVISSEYQSYYSLFRSETTVRHIYNAKAESVWAALTSLSKYNLWFPGVRRMLPVVDTERYVHKFSFDQFNFSPGAFIHIHTNAVSPSFRGRIMTVEENKELSLSMRFGPLNKELVTFSLDSNPDGSTVVTCHRTSKGLFSFFTLIGFAGSKSHILSNLGYFIPEDKKEKRAGGSLQGHLEKALKDGPPPEASSAAVDPAASALPSFSNDDDLIAYVVHKAIDGDMEPINSIQDRALRGKAKSTMVRAKRSGNLPPMPEKTPNAAPAKDTGSAPALGEESEAEFIQKLVTEGLSGTMDSINAIEDRALRAKVKSALVKAKRAQK